jgi:hypothetical protein
MKNTLPKAIEKSTEMVVEFEVMPEIPSSSEKLVRIYNELLTGAHYVSAECFAEFFTVIEAA